MAMIGPWPLGLPSGAPRVMKLANRVALSALARIVVTASPPITIESLRLMKKKSMPADTSGVGSKTMPSVRCSDFSGLRLGLPPVTVANWLPQSEADPVCGFGQRIGSRVLFAVTLLACGLKRSVRDDARKALPTEARVRRSRIGVQ